MNTREDWSLRPATARDHGGVVALLALALPFDILDGPFRAVDAAAVTAACWAAAPPDGPSTDGPSTDGRSTGGMVRLVSVASAGTLPGPDGIAVAVPAGVALASVGPGAGGTGTSDARVGYLHVLAVHPAHRGGGLGRTLLAGVTAALLDAGAVELTTSGRPPDHAWPATDPRYTAFGLLLAAAGWRATAVVPTMTVDLDAASRDGRLDTAADLARLAGAGIQIRRAAAADRAAVTAAAAAFDPAAAGSSWPAELDRALDRDPGGVHLAVRGERVVGFAGHGVSRPDWVGPVGVVAGERHAGIGAVLLRRCLVDIRAEGRGAAQLRWADPVGFHARTVGAHLDRTFTVHTRTA